mgnify:CR=1 FL=1
MHGGRQSMYFSKINVEGQSREGTERYTGLFQLVNIIRLRQKLQFKEIIEVISDSSIGPNYEDSLSDYGRVIYYYYAALANIEIGNHQGANDFLFDLLNPLDKRLATNPVYTSVFVLLHLIVLAEISNAKHIGYLLPKYKKYLQKTDRLGAFEEHFISMFAQLISPRYKYNLESVYSRFLKRLKQAREEGLSNVLILEDDMVFTKDFDAVNSYVEAFLKDFKNTWDVLFLATNVFEYFPTMSPQFKRVTKSLCAHAYAVNCHYLKKLENCFELACQSMRDDELFMDAKYIN